MRNHERFGHPDKGVSGGYQNIRCNDANTQARSNAPSPANEKAAKVMTKHQKNHVGGPRAGT